jgi:hypothetical protein
LALQNNETNSETDRKNSATKRTGNDTMKGCKISGLRQIFGATVEIMVEIQEAIQACDPPPSGAQIYNRQ